jgi:uncharacterized coiled-coil protein SlyX
MKGLLVLLLGIGAFGAGMGVQALLAAGGIKALQDEVARCHASVTATQGALKLAQAKLDGMPEQIRQAVEAEKTRLGAAFRKDKDKLRAEITAANEELRKSHEESEARMTEAAQRLAQATRTIATLNEVAEAQKNALSKNNEYIATLGAKLRAAYANTQDVQGQASVDKLDADRAQTDAAIAQRRATAAQAETDSKAVGRQSPAKQPAK